MQYKEIKLEDVLTLYKSGQKIFGAFVIDENTELKTIALCDGFLCEEDSEKTAEPEDEPEQLSEIYGEDRDEGHASITQETSPKEVKKPEQETKLKKGNRQTVDHGKIIALYKAGWSVSKIVDEMGCSDQTVRNHIQREGL